MHRPNQRRRDRRKCGRISENNYSRVIIILSLPLEGNGNRACNLQINSGKYKARVEGIPIFGGPNKCNTHRSPVSFCCLFLQEHQRLKSSDFVEFIHIKGASISVTVNEERLPLNTRSFCLNQGCVLIGKELFSAPRPYH